MTLRDNITDAKRAAHCILDQVKAGLNVPLDRIQFALAILGDVE